MMSRMPFFALMLLGIGGVVLLIVFLSPSGRDNGAEKNPPTEIVVETPVGPIRGLRVSDEYDMFLGIPYARVNVSNHFGASTAYGKLDGIFDATNDLARCPQLENGRPIGGIDCLQLNIFVPGSASRSNALPVMVWINGESFETSSKSAARFGPKYLVRHDVIYVSINYRVGPYGFMCLDIPEVPGNQGLKDQVLALRWVKDNIASFGGDISKITAFGTSAGGQSIDFHIISDNEQLFRNAIIQSGSSLSSNVFTRHNKMAPIYIAQILGHETSSLLDALSFLSAQNVDSVIQAWKELDLDFRPCQEMQFANVEPFLTRHWVNADKQKAKNMSILIGYNEDELLLRYVTRENFEHFNVVEDRLLETFDFDEKQLNASERNLRKFYFGDKRMNPELMQLAVTFDSDYTYVHPIHRSIKKYLISEAERVFMYKFSYNGGRNVAKYLANVKIGTAAHGDEAGYLFDTDIFAERPTTNDQVMIDRMTTMWTNFAKYSNPTPQVTGLLNVIWPPIVNGSFNCFFIDTNFTVSRRPAHDRMAFMDLFYKLNEAYQIGYQAN